jgi:glycosyltransferase involved in cell wall biosynthesis
MLLAVIVSTIFVSMVSAAVPAVLFVVNLRRYRAPVGEANGARVAVLIPARDEERNIAACVESVLASTGVELEVLVLDDASSDRTAEIVREIAARDARVRLLHAPVLPAGWNGKQHACWILAQESRAPMMLFLDADVRVAPDAIARCEGARRRQELALLSGFPRGCCCR